MTKQHRLLLINPPVNRLCGVAQNYYPLGLGYLAAGLNRDTQRVSIYNAELEIERLPPATNRRRLDNHRLFVDAMSNDSHAVWREYRAILATTKPDLVGFSCTSASIMPCLKMAADAKRQCGAITVFGGMHATILPEQTARQDSVDYVVAGEAESSFRILVEHLDRGASPTDLPGIGCVRNGQFLFTPPPPLEHDLSTIPLPDRDCLVQRREHAPHLGAMLTSRGCPRQCTFCSGRRIHSGRVRLRPIPDVLDEMELLVERYRQDNITFYDDALILDKKRTVSLCQGILARRFHVNWGGFTRVDSVDRDLLALMKESGCSFLGCGVESGSDHVLTRIKKGYTRAQAIAGVNMIREAGIPVAINVIAGFPFETRQDFEDTISLVTEVQVPTNVNTLCPYPGSEVYEECRALGLIGDTIDWTTVSQHSHYNSFVHAMSDSDYRLLLDQLVTLADRYTPPTSAWSQHINAILGLWQQAGHSPWRFSEGLARKVWRRLGGRLG